MKKIVNVVVLSILVALGLPGVTHAMSVADPTGVLINGWYKDSFSVDVSYGDGTCTGNGTANNVIYKAGVDQDGVHQYFFLSDDLDNPYLSFDGGPQQPLLSPLPCPPLGPLGFNLERRIMVQLDSQPPTVSITSPISGQSTNASSVSISGTVNDTASGVKSVQLIVNGAAGPIASLNGNTFQATVNLSPGSNNIHAVALDNVDHSDTSNSVSIQRGGSASSTNPASSSPSNSTSTATSPTTSSTPTSNNPAGQTNGGPIKFNQGHVINLTNNTLDPPSDPNQVLAENGFVKNSNKIYYFFLSILFFLLCLSAFMIWRFKPIFTKLDRSNSGLRRRIALIVTLPSLLPLIGLGFLGYQQLSNGLRSSLSQELARAAQTSAIKLEREFSIRRKIITSNASDILQIKAQYQDQYVRLEQQRNDCSLVAKSAFKASKYNQITSSDSCLPFLAAFAQLANPATSSIDSYTQVINDGYDHTLSDIKADEQQRINTLLSAMRGYFPDINEVAIISSGTPAKTIAVLPASSNVHPIIDTHKDLLSHAQSTNLILFDKHLNSPQLIFTYPITGANKTLLGNVIVAFDTTNANFIPAIWRATPKPYSQDAVFFVNDQGEQIYPKSTPQLSSQSVRQIVATKPASLLDVSANKQHLATRVSLVSGTNIAVAVGAPPKTILTPLAGIQRLALLAILCFLLASLLLGIFFISGIATEIESLLKGALLFAKGELNHKIHIPEHDELQVLADTMNQMATDIKVAQAALIEKDKEFINIATHELKAPMTAIMGNLDMIKSDGIGVVDETASELIDQAYIGTVRLRDLVTDMLDVARLESGKAQFKLEPIDMTVLTKAVIDMQAITAKQTNLTLSYVPPTNLPTVVADKNKVQIILTNFISNAIKYNRPNGTITISHELKDGFITTAVADTGLGIPEDQQAHIFEKFYRVQHDDRANVPGTGLGMHLTKRFIESMGGKTWFTSVHGQGTTFYFTLPLVVTPADTESETNRADSPA